MSVLVTGASGFVGRHVVKALSELGCEVHAVARRGDNAEVKSVVWHRADLTDPGQMHALLSKVRATHLVHGAWYAQPGAFWESNENLTWLAASTILLRAFVENGGKHVVGIGSCGEILGNTLYARSKSALRSVGEVYCTREGAGFAWARIFFVYGAGEPREKFISSLLARFEAGERVVLKEPDRRLDYVHVSDVANALATLAIREVTGVFDVGSGHGYRVRELAEIAAGAVGGSPEELIQCTVSANADVDLIADSAAMQGLGWRCLVDVETGISKMAAVRSCT